MLSGRSGLSAGHVRRMQLEAGLSERVEQSRWGPWDGAGMCHRSWGGVPCGIGSPAREEAVD